MIQSSTASSKDTVGFRSAIARGQGPPFPGSAISGVRLTLTLTLTPMPGPGNGGPREWGAGTHSRAQNWAVYVVSLYYTQSLRIYRDDIWDRCSLVAVYLVYLVYLVRLHKDFIFSSLLE